MNRVKITAKEKYEVVLNELKSLQEQVIEVDKLLAEKDDREATMTTTIAELMVKVEKKDKDLEAKDSGYTKLSKVQSLSMEEIETLKRQIKTRDDLLQMVPVFENVDLNELTMQKFPEIVEDNRSIEEKYSALKTLFSELQKSNAAFMAAHAEETESVKHLELSLDTVNRNYVEAVKGRREFRQMYRDAREANKVLSKENEELKDWMKTKRESCKNES